MGATDNNRGGARSKERLRSLLAEAARRSTCHAIQLGVVIEASRSEYVLGWNGPPARSGPHAKCLLGEFITPDNIGRCPSVHAEVRAIYRAAQRGTIIEGATLYLSEWFCCSPCAAAMIEAGISRLVLTEKIDYSKDACYNFRLARELLDAAGVAIEIDPDLKQV